MILRYKKNPPYLRRARICHWLGTASSQHQYSARYPLWELNCCTHHKEISTSQVYVLKKQLRNPIFCTVYLKSELDLFLDSALLSSEIPVHLRPFWSATRI